MNLQCYFLICENFAKKKGVKIISVPVQSEKAVEIVDPSKIVSEKARNPRKKKNNEDLASVITQTPIEIMVMGFYPPGCQLC